MPSASRMFVSKLRVSRRPSGTAAKICNLLMQAERLRSCSVPFAWLGEGCLLYNEQCHEYPFSSRQCFTVDHVMLGIFQELVLVTFRRIPPPPLKGRWPVLMPPTPTPTPLRCSWRWFVYFERITFRDLLDMYFVKLIVFYSHLVSALPPLHEGDQYRFTRRRYLMSFYSIYLQLVLVFHMRWIWCICFLRVCLKGIHKLGCATASVLYRYAQAADTADPQKCSKSKYFRFAPLNALHSIITPGRVQARVTKQIHPQRSPRPWGLIPSTRPNID